MASDSRMRRTFVVYNSSQPDGKAFADLYAQLRGATDYYALGFPFGPAGQATYAWNSNKGSLLCAASQRPGALNEAAYVGQPITDAVFDFAYDHGLTALIVDPTVPKSFVTTGSYDVYNPLEAVIALEGAVPPWFATPGVGAPDTGNVSSLASIDPGFSRGWRYRQAVRSVTGSGGEVSSLALRWGRIGWSGCSMANVERCVQDAMWAETQDNRGKMFVIGGAMYDGAGQADLEAAAHLMGRDFGLSDLWHFDYAAANPGWPEYNQRRLSFSAFTALPGQLQIAPFGLLVQSQLGNTGSRFLPGGAVFENYNPPRGAFGSWWTSFAYNFADMALAKGACAAWTTYGEPSSVGIAMSNGLLLPLIYGAPMLAASAFAQTVIGDPLYAPFKNTPVRMQAQEGPSSFAVLL